MLQRYWATILGGSAIVVVVVASILSIGSSTVGNLVETAMRGKGRAFAELLMSERGNVDAFLTDIARDSDAELTVRNVAGLANIDSFAIFDRRGQEVFRSRSDRYRWLLRDRPGGITSGDRLAESVLERRGDWQIVEDDGVSNPSVITPLMRDGRLIGYVSVVGDMAGERAAYALSLATASLSLMGVLLGTTGLPALLYVRRRRKIAEADDRIQFLANYDPLTNLFNRKRMQEETERVLATSRATREQRAFCFIDVDRLSDINDALGRPAGDEVLRQIAKRLTGIIGCGDLLARMGNDDFTLLTRRLDDPKALHALMGELRRAVCEPMEVGGKTIRPQVSVGVALMPRDGRTHDDLLTHAELALFHHKATKGGDYAVFEPYMDEETVRRREIEGKVREAVETDAFELFYQPIVSGDGMRLLGVEALIRLPDGEGGYLSPGVFVPIAESRGYIKAMGAWVIREASRQAAAWPDELFVSINLSAMQFRDGDIVDIVQGALAQAGIPGSRLEIEVVESLLLERSEEVLRQLGELRALGISIDMDDFGTGYSSLGYLWRFPFDKLKIDQSFMSALEGGEPNVREIIGTIIALGHSMHMKVTAEGVETKRQATLLREMGCDQLQGYLFGRPMPAARIAAEVLSAFGNRVGAAAGRPASPEPDRRAIGSGGN